MSSADPALTCLEMVARLDDYIDRNLHPGEIRRVEAHLAGCIECAREFRFESAVLDAIRQRLHRIAVPPDLLSDIRARLARAGGTNPG